MREFFDRQRSAVKVLLVLLVGVTAGVVVGGAVHLFGPPGSNEARAAGAGATPVAPPPPASNAPLLEGDVVADDAAATLVEPSLGRVRTTDGAVAAFTSYAVWLVGSPTATQDPAKAVSAVGGALLNPVDAQLLVNRQRADGDGFAASRGAYRIIGHSGDVSAPTEVMVEVTAPLTVAGRSRWSTIGGVVTWTPTGWKLTSIRPSEVAQPAPEARDARSFAVRDRARTLNGLGWRTFSRPRAR